MASEIRVDKITSLSGVGTITPSPTGIEISGITTVATLKATTGIVTTLTATTGIVTTLTANTVTSLSDVKVGSGVTLSPDGDVSITGVTTFTSHIDASSDVFISDKIIHAGDTNTRIRFPDADIISFENGAGGETARFSATNQFSVGTTADITGANVAIAGSMRLVNATGESATISALPSGSYITGVSGGSAIVFHRFSDGGGGSDEIAFETHHQGTRHGEAARFNKSGNLVFPSGQGIDFSATGQAASPSSEILDDYEEGTWTVVITPGGGSYQYNYGQTGYYRKIGNTVFINIWIHLTVSSAVSGGISLSGLPFTCQDRSRNWIPVGGYNHGGPPQSSSGLWMIVGANSTTGSFTYNDDQFGSTSTLTAGNLPTAAELYINGSYFTDQ